MAILQSGVWNDSGKLMSFIEILLNSTLGKAAYYTKLHYLLTLIAYTLSYFMQFWVVFCPI